MIRIRSSQQNPAVMVQWSDDYLLSSSIETTISLLQDASSERKFDIDVRKANYQHEITYDEKTREKVLTIDVDKSSCRYLSSDALSPRIYNISQDIYCLFDYLTQGEEGDDVYYLYDTITVKSDFDQNDHRDQLDFSWYREGGRLMANINGRSTEYTSPIGPNIQAIGFSDFNSDGTNDVFINFERDTSQNAIVLLDGSR